MGPLCENIRRGKRRLEASETLTATESEVPLTATSLAVLIGVAVLTPRNRIAATLMAREMKNLIVCDGSRVDKEREWNKGLQESKGESIIFVLCVRKDPVQ
jgi:hypothetical protein